MAYVKYHCITQIVSDARTFSVRARVPPLSPYLRCVVGLLLALCPHFAGTGLLSELLQTGLQLQLFLAGLAKLPRLLAVHCLQLAAKLALLGAQLP